MGVAIGLICIGTCSSGLAIIIPLFKQKKRQSSDNANKPSDETPPIKGPLMTVDNEEKGPLMPVDIKENPLKGSLLNVEIEERSDVTIGKTKVFGKAVF